MDFPLKDNDVFSVELAAPGLGGGGGSGVAFGEKVVSGGTDFREIVNMGVFREGEMEAGKGCTA